MNSRLRSFTERKKLRRGDLADILNTTPQTITNVLSGKHLPSATVLQAFSVSYPELNMRWVLTGDGEMTDLIQNKTTKDYEIKLEACLDLSKLLKKQLDDKEKVIRLLEEKVDYLNLQLKTA